MTTGWRVVHQRYAPPGGNPFDGEGSGRYGGRWNSSGVAVVYLSAHRSLAVLETLVHAPDRSVLLHHVMFSATFPGELIEVVAADALPADWQNPQAPPALREFGDGWVRGRRSAVLQVPSAVVFGEWNFVLNPEHPDFPRVVVGPQQPLPIDPRLLVSGEATPSQPA